MEQAAAFEVLLKEYLKPWLWNVLAAYNRTLEQEGNRYRIIVAGGEALSRFFSGLKPIYTHDIDLRVALNYAMARKEPHPYHESNFRALQAVSESLTRTLTRTLNEAVRQIPLVSLEKKYHCMLVGQRKAPFAMERLASIREGDYLLRTITYSYRAKDGKVYKSSLVDVLIPGVSVDPKYPLKVAQYAQFLPEFTGQPILSSTNRSGYPIPYVDVGGVSYARLGYVVLDAIVMYTIARDPTDRAHKKLARYQDKYQAVIAALNAPSAHLSCLPMKEFVDECRGKLRKCHDASTAELARRASSLDVQPTPELLAMDKYALCDYLDGLEELLSEKQDA